MNSDRTAPATPDPEEFARQAAEQIRFIEMQIKSRLSLEDWPYNGPMVKEFIPDDIGRSGS
jgi:hypothetical protein